MMDKSTSDRAAISLFLLTLTCTPSTAQEADNPLEYPEARRIEAVDVYHGERIIDPYQWMEEANSPELKSWIDSQVELTDAYLDSDLWMQTRSRIAELETFDQQYVPIKAGDRYFFSRFPSFATDKTSIHVRENVSASARELVSPPYHYGDSTDPDLVRFGGFAPSGDGNTLAYISSGDGSVWHRARFVDVATGRLLEDELRGLNRIAATLSWHPGSDRLYYVRFDEPEDHNKFSAPVVNGRIFQHTLGKPQSEDTLIFEPGDDELVPTVTATLDGDYVVVHVLDPRTQTNRIFVKSSSHQLSPTQELFRDRSARFTYLANDGSTFWIYTNDQAPNGQILEIELATGEQSVVVEERTEAISGGSFVGGNAIGKFGDQFVILYMQDGVPLIRIFDLGGHLKHEVPVPTGGSVWGGFAGRADDPDVFFGYIGMFDPFAVYRMDARTGKFDLYERSAPKNLDAAEFEVKQVFFDGHDGTRVPMFLTYSKGLKPDGTNPALLYGYGAFGWNSFLFYQSHLIAWLEMGGVYAQPGLRGGGEYGQAWHDAGKGVNKENTVRDFIAAADWLIDNGFASRELLVANGGSASAMPAAAAMQRRPDLFSAAIIDRPALDMLRFNRFTQGRLWLDEFGAPDTPDEYRALRRLSPYHNLAQGECYPPTIVLIGESDPVTPPLHGYKYVARLQQVQGCANPTLMYLMPKTAHTFGSSPAQVINSRTAMIAFLAQTLNLPR